MERRKIAIYGKGGIGKSTTCSNLAAALSQKYTVMQIGCDPKADSCKDLLGGRRIPTVLDQIRDKGEELALEDVVFRGYNGIYCVESGGPTPGIGCAGLGIIAAFQKLESLHAFERFRPEIVLYDVLGDVVCGGFAMPIRDGYAEDIFIVTSGEMMALYAADNIHMAVDRFRNRAYARCGGLILNHRNVDRETELVERAAREMGVEVVAEIRRSGLIQQAEDRGMTAIEAFPDSDIAEDYRALADCVLRICEQSARESSCLEVGVVARDRRSVIS